MKKVAKTAVLAALRSLGKAPDEVAASLGRKKCKGHRLLPCNCPISVFLSKEFPGTRFSVGKDAIALIEDHVAPKLPRACWQFICSFDRGEYPKLVLLFP